jgi:threonyl-tRNA synthetase
MAQVLEEMYPGIKLTLGPAISMGFIMMWILKIRKSLMLISKKIEDRVLEISEESMNSNCVLFLKQKL